jgi:hypothetical protein
MAADGPGPEYCYHCKRTRGRQERCDGCLEPEILPEVEPAISLYLAVQSQWRYSGMGQATGLDYAGVEAAMRLMGIPSDPELFGLLQVAERAVLDVTGEKRKVDKSHGR